MTANARMFNPKELTRTAVTALLVLLTLPGPDGQLYAQDIAVAPEAEVVHWWSKGSDAAAVQVIINEYTRRGGQWFNSVEIDHQATRESAVSRMAKGYPPTALQWNGGAEVRQFAELGLLKTFTDPAQVEALTALYSDAVIDVITRGEEIVAVPVSVHGENWLWYNADLISQEALGSEISWSAFVALLEALKSKEITALAVGNEAWQHRVIFNNVFLGVAGPDLFNAFYHNLDKSVLQTDAFLTALETTRRLIPHARSFGSGSWEDQVAAVSRGDAAAALLGDWAKGQFLRLEQKLGTDFGCVLAPGTQSSYMLVLDVFMLGKVSSEAEMKGQALLLEVLQDRDTSQRFNQIKGSLAPFREIEPSVMDHCSLGAKELLNDTASVIAPFASFGDGAFQAQIETTASKLFTGKFATIADAVTAFDGVLRGERLRRRGQMITINSTE